MTLTKRAFHPVVAMRSLGEFDRMWREMEKSFKEAWPVASEKLPRLYSGWELLVCYLVILLVHA